MGMVDDSGELEKVDHTPVAMPVGFIPSVRASLSHLTPARLRRALFGAQFPPPPEAPPSVIESPSLSAQMTSIYLNERARSSETRKRSDQLLGRVLTVSPLVVGTIVLSIRNANNALSIFSFVIGLLSTASLAASFAAVLRNLGQEVHYAPLTSGDLRSDHTLRAVKDSDLVRERYRAVVYNEGHNNDAIDRLHSAHALFVLAVILALVAGSFAVALIGQNNATAERAESRYRD